MSGTRRHRLTGLVVPAILAGYVSNPRNKASLLAAAKGEKPKRVSQFLRCDGATIDLVVGIQLADSDVPIPHRIAVILQRQIGSASRQVTAA